MKTDDKTLFDEMDGQLSMRLEPVAAPEAQPEGEAVLSEWERECEKKSIPIYSRHYRLK